MPLYDYECSSCEHLLNDVFQKVSDKPLVRCPKCGKHKLFKVITGGVHGRVVAYNTIGSVADRNTKKNKNKLSEEQAKKLEENPPPPKPWYHGNASAKEINKMTEAQKKRYVMEGKT